VSNEKTDSSHHDIGILAITMGWEGRLKRRRQHDLALLVFDLGVEQPAPIGRNTEATLRGMSGGRPAT